MVSFEYITKGTKIVPYTHTTRVGSLLPQPSVHSSLQSICSSYSIFDYHEIGYFHTYHIAKIHRLIFLRNMYDFLLKLYWI